MQLCDLGFAALPYSRSQLKTSVPPRYEKSWEMEEVEERRKVTTLIYITHTLKGLLFHHTDIISGCGEETHLATVW